VSTPGSQENEWHIPSGN